MYTYELIASSYDCGAYGGSAYQTGSCSTTTTTTTTSSSSGLLTNTGFDLLLAATLAATIIFVALILQFWKRSGKKKASDL